MRCQSTGSQGVGKIQTTVQGRSDIPQGLGRGQVFSSQPWLFHQQLLQISSGLFRQPQPLCDWQVISYPNWKAFKWRHQENQGGRHMIAPCTWQQIKNENSQVDHLVTNKFMVPCPVWNWHNILFQLNSPSIFWASIVWMLWWEVGTNIHSFHKNLNLFTSPEDTAKYKSGPRWRQWINNSMPSSDKCSEEK